MPPKKARVAPAKPTAAKKRPAASPKKAVKAKVVAKPTPKKAAGRPKKAAASEDDSAAAHTAANHAADASPHLHVGGTEAGVPRTDPTLAAQGWKVAGLWATELCQAQFNNTEHDHNKFFRLQLLEKDGKFAVFSRWGKILYHTAGDSSIPANTNGGQSKLEPFPDREKAEKAFGGKFKDKTGNDWGSVCRDPAAWTAKNGKYTWQRWLKAGSARGCPNGHLMSSFVPKDVEQVKAGTIEFECDGCRRTVASTEWMHSCRFCGWDVCEKCFANRKPLPA